MHTLMEDRIKQAFAEWKKADQEPQQPAKAPETTGESNVQFTSRGTVSQALLGYITAHPGVTGTELRKIVKEKFPTTPISYVPACLKNMYDSFHVRRVPVENDKWARGRSTFAYYALTEQERIAERNRPKSRVMKAKKSKKVRSVVRTGIEVIERESTVGTGITALAPTKSHATHALEVGPATISIAIKTSDGVSYSLSLPDAKYIYTQLNQIFGGVR